MKKVGFRKFALIALSMFVILSQSGCKKSSLEDLDDTVTPSTANKILYRISSNDNSINSLWSVKADGSDKHKINIVLPAGWQLDNEDMAEVTSDGLTLVFLAYNATTDLKAIYKCNIDGSGVTGVTTPVTSSIGLQAMISKTTVLYWKELQVAGYNLELWSVNLDGTNNHAISIILPAGFGLQEEELAKVTSDGKSIVFMAMSTITGEEYIYKCNIDGSNPVMVTSEAREYYVAIQSLTDDHTVLYRKTTESTADELWSVYLDGTGKQRINIALPANTQLLDEEMAKGTKGGLIYFSTVNTVSGKVAINVCNYDGTALKVITEETADNDIAIQSLY